MQAVRGTDYRQAQRRMLFFVLIAAAVLAAAALGYGIRAWTSTTSVAATTAPAIQQVSHGAPQGHALPDRADVPTPVRPPAALPDRSDVTGSTGGQQPGQDDSGVLRSGHPR